MNGLWPSLVPLIVGSAFVPMQILVTILLLRASRLAALAWVAGMACFRLVQGVVFGLMLSSSDAVSTDATGDDGAGLVVSTLLLMVAVLLLVTGVRQVMHEDDPDAPPPKWLEVIDNMSPPKAFGAGVAILAIGAKFWVFTLGAIGVIGDAALGQSTSIAVFVVFVVLAGSIHLVLLGVVVAAPSKSEAVLEASANWLTRNNRVILIVISFVFGVWFLLQALDGFGII